MQKIKAYELYMTTALRLHQIAKETNTPRGTIVNWINTEKWNVKREAMKTQGMSRIDQVIVSATEKSADTVYHQLEQIETIGAKLDQALTGGKEINVTEIKALVQAAQAVRAIHQVSKTLLPERIKNNNAKHSVDLPKNPVFFQLNVRPVAADRITRAGDASTRTLEGQLIQSSPDTQNKPTIEDFPPV